MLRGGHDKAAEANCLIVGGHTVDDNEPKYGLSVVGLVAPGRQVSNAGARPGDALVLTKPIGTGVITTAGKAGVAPPRRGGGRGRRYGNPQPRRIRGDDGHRRQRLHRRKPASG